MIIEYNFANPDNYSYDSNALEIVTGQMRKKDKRPDNATFYADFETDANANWGNGELAYTAKQGSVSDGVFNAHDSDSRYVEYSATGNADSPQKGCFRFRIKPYYSGSPANHMIFLDFNNGVDNQNRILLYHGSSSQIALKMFDETGSPIINENLGSYSAILESIFEIELNYDITNGQTRIFIDGVQHGSTQTNTGTRNPADMKIRIGNTYNETSVSNFDVDDILIYSEPQHTENYTPDWSGIYGTVYLPGEYTISPHSSQRSEGLKFIEVSEAIIGNDELRYIINIDGVDKYFNTATGSWENSDGTLVQANTLTEINDNCADLVINKKNIFYKLIFSVEETDSQSSIQYFTMSFDFYGGDPDYPPSVIVWGYIHDFNPDDPVSLTLLVKPEKKIILQSNNVRFPAEWIVVEIREDGYFEVEIYYINDDFRWVFDFQDATEYVKVPAGVSEINFNSVVIQ